MKDEDETMHQLYSFINKFYKFFKVIPNVLKTMQYTCINLGTLFLTLLSVQLLSLPQSQPLSD